jgi:hypothetical protein
MIADMAAIAVECVKRPRTPAVWSPQFGRYVCPQTDNVPPDQLEPKSKKRPPISPLFKLVFGAAAAGTILSLGLCAVLAIAAGKEPPTLMTEVVRGLFSLAQVGFGAIVGLLGAKRLEGDANTE